MLIQLDSVVLWYFIVGKFDRFGNAEVGGLFLSKFYRAHGSLVVEVYGDEAHELTCCGTELKELTPNTVDAAHEKHVPVPTYDAAKNEVRVSVGSVAHPMTEGHLIDWVLLVTKKGEQRLDLTPEDAPAVTFRLADGDAPVKVLAYCNLHGLWQAEI